MVCNFSFIHFLNNIIDPDSATELMSVRSKLTTRTRKKKRSLRPNSRFRKQATNTSRYNKFHDNIS